MAAGRSMHPPPSPLTDAGRRGGRPLHARCHRNALSLKHRLIITDAQPFSLSRRSSLPSLAAIFTPSQPSMDTGRGSCRLQTLPCPFPSLPFSFHSPASSQPSRVCVPLAASGHARHHQQGSSSSCALRTRPRTHSTSTTQTGRLDARISCL